MTYDPSFMGVTSLTEPLLTNELENNYKSFLNWGFLQLGGFTNVVIPTVNISSFDLHKLKPATDPQYTTNTVWQTPRKDWIYESGSFGAVSTVAISGVSVSGTLYPAPTGNAALGYSINYPEGKVIFNKAVPSGATVQMEYSYRNVQIYTMEEFPYWQQIQYNSLENKTGFSLSDRGDFAINSEHRIQLPAIVIESVARSDAKPFKLGNKSLVIKKDVLLHVLSDDPRIRNNITDIIQLQEDRVIWLYNTREIIKSGVYPLDYKGGKNPNGLNYDQVVNDSNYQKIRCQIIDTTISDISFVNIRMYGSIIRLTNEIIVENF